MLFLKQLRLVNYCAYEDHTFSFVKDDGAPYQFICFFGPNGTGKSTLLDSISMLSMNNVGRGENFVKQSLQKYVRDPDFDPTWGNIEKKQQNRDMLIEGTYVMDNKEYIVQLTQNGYIRNDFAPIAPPESDEEEIIRIMRSGPWGDKHLIYRQRIAHFIKSDSDLSMHKIQIHISQKEKFEKIVSQITRYPTECILPKGMTSQERSFCTDFVIKKTKSGEKYTIHFKRMSIGEKKICKSFSELLNLMYSLENPITGQPMPGWPRLILIDNLDLHIYFDRHVSMVQSLLEVFKKQQIFATTHSGVLVPRFLRNEHDEDKELMFDLDAINS